MSNTDLPVSELAEVSSISDSDLLYVVASGASKGIKKQNVLKEVNQTLQTKADLVGGKVPASELPSYVDDVIEGYYNDNDGKFYEDAQYTTEITPETGKIYMDLNTDKSYRWTGSAYLCIGGGLELGETSTTAYRGDRGKTAYDHATDANRSTTAQNLGLYKIGVTSEGHVSNPTAVQASDITGLVDVDKVKQSPDSTNTSYEVLLSGSADNVEHTEYVKKNNKFTHNPSTGDTTIGGLLTDKNGVQSYKALTQAEYDLLPASKNSDGVLYIITDGENPLDVQLWNKVGTASLDTQANDLSNAVNELSASLVNLGDLLSAILFVGKGTLTNLNDAQRVAGQITINTFTMSASNKPTNSAGGYLFTFANTDSANYGCQVVVNNEGLYGRRIQGGTWQAWTTIKTWT